MLSIIYFDFFDRYSYELDHLLIKLWLTEINNYSRPSLTIFHVVNCFAIEQFLLTLRILWFDPNPISPTK